MTVKPCAVSAYDDGLSLALASLPILNKLLPELLISVFVLISRCSTCTRTTREAGG
jgi:hypothetical protein